MSELDPALMRRILDHLIDKGTPFYPVSSLAHDLGLAENERGQCAILSNDFVAHLLQLQDLACIKNMLGETSWGYDPLGDEDVDDADFHTGDWNTPHCYSGDHYEAVIRITAEGRQLRDALAHDTLNERAKKSLLTLGGGAAKEILTKLLVGSFIG